MVKYCYLWLCICLLPSLAWAKLEVSLDRNIVTLNQSFQLQLIADQSLEGSPDFSVLKPNFEILQTRQSSQISIINGKQSQQFKIFLTLMPTKVGEFTIPSITWGNQSSQAVKITVTEAPVQSNTKSQQKVFLEVDVQPKTVYFQQELVYTLKVYHKVPLQQAQLSELSSSDNQAIIKKLGDDKSYDTYRQGQRYHVIERHYAIFPQQVGKLSIYPIQFEAELASRQRHNFWSLPSSQIQRLRSQQLTVEVKAIPDSVKQGWLPSKQVQLVETWDKPIDNWQQGETLTRTIALMVDDQVASQLPDIPLDYPDAIKIYPDQPELKNKMDNQSIVAIRQQKIAIRPTQAGQYILPEIQIPWWNVLTERLEYASLPARTINIVNTMSNQAQATDNTMVLDDVADVSITAPEPYIPSWLWAIVVFLSLGWLTTMWLWWRALQIANNISPSLKTTIANASDNLSSTELEQQLKQACLSNQPQQAKKILLQWGRLLPDKANITHLEHLVDDTESRFYQQISQLNQTLYSPDKPIWHGEALWQAFLDFKQTHPPVSTQLKSDDKLVALRWNFDRKAGH